MNLFSRTAKHTSYAAYYQAVLDSQLCMQSGIPILWCESSPDPRTRIKVDPVHQPRIYIMSFFGTGREAIPLLHDSPLTYPK